jgi:hypothetical protein
MVASSPPAQRARLQLPNAPMSNLSTRLKTVRPSLLDLRFSGDAWVVPQPDGTPALFLGGYRLVPVVALPLDLPTLNQMLDRARHQRPRWQKVTRRYQSPHRTPRVRAST